MEIFLEQRYVNLPVKTDAPTRHVRFLIDGQIERAFDIELAEGTPDFWVFADVSNHKGQRLAVQVDGLAPDSAVWKSIVVSDEILGADDLYREKHRPQFHFSSRRGWINDPNGLTFYKGEYHLFYQHNPYGTKWGNMHWGHAVSRDLVHWTELGDALSPDRLGTMFSGSGVVDQGNTAGFQNGDEKTMVCIYTAAGGTSLESRGKPFTQCIAYSNDCGRTWTKYRRNPVIGHIVGRNRDPKVLWHQPSSKWVMALYLAENDYGLFTSSDLKSWVLQDRIEFPGAQECPDLFELPVRGAGMASKWVFWGANGTYLLGHFDGNTFETDGEVHRHNWGNAYAAQTWSNVPVEDGRCIQVSWLRGDIPAMPFNQMMTFPVELSLRMTDDGPRLFSTPVREIESLHRRKLLCQAVSVNEANQVLKSIDSNLLHVRSELQVHDAAVLGLDIRGIQVTYDARTLELSCGGRVAPLAPVKGKVALEVLVDRACVEIFGNHGRVYMPLSVILPEDDRPLSLFSKGGTAGVARLEVYELRSAWG